MAGCVDGCLVGLLVGWLAGLLVVWFAGWLSRIWFHMVPDLALGLDGWLAGW